MFRPKLLFTSLAALALGACSPQDPQAVTSAAIANQVILKPAPTSSMHKKPGPSCNRYWSARWLKATAPGRSNSGLTRKTWSAVRSSSWSTATSRLMLRLWASPA